MSDPFYRTKRWLWLREATLNRSPLCETAGCTAPASVADHVIPRSKGGADSLDNLMSRCTRCHNTRRGTAEPKLKGCRVDGTPDDPNHWWNHSVTDRGGVKNISQSCRLPDRAPGPKDVSSTLRRIGRG